MRGSGNLTIGKNIKNLRLSHHWTQKELSVQLSLTPKMISFYENEDRVPPADILIKLSKIFNVSVDYLLGLSDEKLNVTNAPKITLSPDEETFLSWFRKLNNDYKDIVIGELKKCVKLQEHEYSLRHSNNQQKKQA